MPKPPSRFLSRTPFREPVDFTLLTVLPQARPPWPSGEAAARRLEEQALLSAQDFVEGVATKLQAAGYRAKAVAVLGSPVEQILREAEVNRFEPEHQRAEENHALRTRQVLLARFLHNRLASRRDRTDRSCSAVDSISILRVADQGDLAVLTDLWARRIGESA